MEEWINDVGTALMGVTRAFRKHDLDPPAAIIVPHKTYKSLRMARSGVDLVYSSGHKYQPRMEIAGYVIEVSLDK